MTNRYLYSIVAGLCGLTFAPPIHAQGRGGGRGAPMVRLQPSDKKFDPHDLAGIWTRSNSASGWGGGSTCPDCGDRGFGNDTPPFTSLGQKAFDASQPDPAKPARHEADPARQPLRTQVAHTPIIPAVVAPSITHSAPETNAASSDPR